MSFYGILLPVLSSSMHGALFCLLVIAVAGKDAEYSAYSGLVTTVSVGEPAQAVKMSLDFLGPESFLYPKAACPPFVSECFDQSLSETFQPDLGYSGHHFGGFLASDKFTFEGLRKVLPVIVMLHRLPNSSSMSEVGGSLSLAPSSPLMAWKQLVISQTSLPFSGSASVTILPRGETVEGGLYFLSTSHNRWQIPATLKSLYDVEWAVDLVLDLSEQDVLLPSWLKRDFLASLSPGRFDVRENARLFVSCSLFGTPRHLLSLGIEFGGERIRVPAASLLFPNDLSIPIILTHDTQERLCPTRIRFTWSEFVVIGRQLLAAVSKVVLDYKARSVRIIGLGEEELRRSWTQVPMQTKALVPVFTEPVVRVSEDNPLVVFLPASRSEGLVLINTLTPNELGLLVWRFVRTTPQHSDEEPIDFPGLFESADFSIREDGAMVFRVVPSAASARNGSYLRIHGTRRFVSVILTPVRMGRRLRMHDLALPRPTRLSSNRTEDCAICLSQFLEGEKVQGMQDCVHEFHFECVKGWLETTGRSCPTCRAPVAPRTASSRVVPGPPQEEILEAALVDRLHNRIERGSAQCCRIS